MRRLVNTEEKIADIAISSGFNSVSYFTEIFTKMTGVSPTTFRAQNKDVSLHRFFDYYDILLATKLESVHLLEETIAEMDGDVKMISLDEPDERFGFLHETAIIEYHAVLYASWYACPKKELTYDEYRYQKEQGIRITEPFRAEGLHKVLYQCPHCLEESQMDSKGTELFCKACGKRWEWREDGYQA